MKCDLCEAISAGVAESVSENFVELICRTCNVPMFVLKWHRESLTESEKAEVEELRKKIYPEKKLRGYMRQIKNHWHDHIVRQ